MKLTQEKESEGLWAALELNEDVHTGSQGQHPAEEQPAGMQGGKMR